MSLHLFTRASLLVLSFLPLMGQAHDSQNTLADSAIKVQSALTYRNQSLVTTTTPWLIPGALLGGEAVPADKGFTLDDLQLLGNYTIQNRYSVAAKISAHGSGDALNLELENFWFTFNTHAIVSNSLIELGRISTDTTRTAYFHASDSPFSDAPLLSDVFFGRHFNDMGIKAKTTQGSVTMGLEAWSGKRWPAANNEGAGSAFLQLHPEWQQGRATVGFWVMHSNAKDRNDNRYSSHNHGNATITSPTSNIYFSGTSDLAGGFIHGQQHLGAVMFKAEGEWIQSQSEGDLRNTNNQNSGYEATYEGLRGLLGVAVNKHALSLQYEKLALENVFLNSVNTVFLSETGLQNNGFNPTQLMAAYQWHYDHDFSLRFNWTQSDTTDTQKHHHVGIGVVWHKGLL